MQESKIFRKLKKMFTNFVNPEFFTNFKNSKFSENREIFLVNFENPFFRKLSLNNLENKYFWNCSISKIRKFSKLIISITSKIPKNLNLVNWHICILSVRTIWTNVKFFKNLKIKNRITRLRWFNNRNFEIPEYRPF